MVAVSVLLLPFVAAARVLGNSPKPDSKVARNVLEGKNEGYCSPSGPIESTNCAYETVESLNKDLFPALHNLVYHPFFRFYKVDLYRECPFWQENGFCMNRACGVDTIDESEIPEKWRSQALGKVDHSDADGVSASGCYFRDDDFCFIEDDATPEGQYIDLIQNPERFTGYAGDSATQVWQAIYKENCFGLSEASLEAARNGDPLPPGKSTRQGLSPGMPPIGFGNLQEGWGTEMIEANDLCEEKKLYYRIISGLHASISIHICADYMDQKTGLWAPNLDCFITRLATHPERLSNVYFNAVLLLRAVARAAPYFRAYDIGIAPRGKETECTIVQRREDVATRGSLNHVLQLAETVASGFDEEQFFNGPDAPILKEQFKDHFRNVSRIMDCVGCDKCRLWGKLQVSGIGTALKILFALDEKDLDPKLNPNLLQRSEVVALFNTLHRVTESLSAVEDFRRIYAQTQRDEAERLARVAAEREAARIQAEKDRQWSLSWCIAAVLSLLEAVRRSCTGCVDAARQLFAGPAGKTEL